MTDKVDENITRRLTRRFPQVVEKIPLDDPLPEMRGFRQVRPPDGRTLYGLQAIRRSQSPGARCASRKTSGQHYLIVSRVGLNDVRGPSSGITGRILKAIYPKLSRFVQYLSTVQEVRNNGSKTGR
jgi:hypothetical protein